MPKSSFSNNHLKEELIATLEDKDHFNRLSNLATLLPDAEGPLLDLVLDFLVDEKGNEVADILILCAGYLDQSQLERAFSIVSNLGDPYARNSAIGALGIYIPQDQQEHAIKLVSSTSDALARLPGLLGLMPILGTDLKREALTTIKLLSDPAPKSNALVRIMDFLPQAWVREALEEARSIPDDFERTNALTHSIGALPAGLAEEVTAEAYQNALKLKGSNKVIALMSLLRYLPDNLHTDAISAAYRAASKIPDIRLRPEALVRVAEHQDANTAASTYGEIFDTLRQITDEKILSEELSLIAPKLPSAQLPQALEIATSIQDAATKSHPVLLINRLMADASTQTEDSSSLPPVETLGNVMSSAEVPEVIEPPQVTKSKKGPTNTAQQQIIDPEIPEPPVATSDLPSESPALVATQLHCDKWTLDDQLNYALYADAIAEFIRQKDTTPSLSIGILAPWGQGKTTLMRLIQYQIERKREKDNRFPDGGSDEQNALLEAEVKANLYSRSKPSSDAPVKSKFKELFTLHSIQDLQALDVPRLTYPTVWFNAWKYQTDEQVWAGMAYAIISQLVDQIPDQLDREKFWLYLQAERINFQEIRRSLYQLIFERVLPWMAVFITLSIIGLVFAFFGAAIENIAIAKSGSIATIAGALSAIGTWFLSKKSLTEKPLEGLYSKLVRQPRYDEKLGFLHEVEADMRRVFEKLVDDKKPAVIFVDDLDRCSPGTVAKVIEAINLFLSGSYPNTYFVLGMDAQVVAASMEVAYKDLTTKLADSTRSYGSLGWYFMDKFIQLQFVIPNLSAAQQRSFLGELFKQDMPDRTSASKKKKLESIEKEVEKELEQPVMQTDQLVHSARKIATLRDDRPVQWLRLTQKLVETGAKTLTDNHSEVDQHLRKYTPYLGTSPRSIKRFANLYRFYSLAQLMRQSQGLPAAAPSALARWLVLMLRWPQLVRWIQWETGAHIGNGFNPLDKARFFEKNVAESDVFEKWLGSFDKKELEKVNWLRDPELYNFLKADSLSEEALHIAIEVGVW